MVDRAKAVVIGVTAGVATAVLAATCVLLAIWLYRRRASVAARTRLMESSTATLRTGAASLDSSVSVSVVSESVADWGHPPEKRTAFWAWRSGGHNGREPPLSVSGIPKYHYKDLQKATSNFTTILGQGSFGPVYKAVMATGEVVAVKVLASDSRQGEREFHTEVALLSRLHHRNLVNLVGYCVEKGQRILIYEYMSNGSLARLLYGENKRSLSWQERLQIADDVSHGIEYLHEGAVPPVIHRDLKSDNILLDHSMRAKVADFGLSKEEVYDGRKSGLKGTYGYMDPDYMSTNKLTKKSDVYSFGIILFELITAINPQQGLMEYINLAAIGGEGRVDWVEILDKNLLVGNIPEEVRMLADVAYRCVNKSPRKRPWISEVTQAISRLRQRQLMKHDALILPRSETRTVLSRIEHQHVELSDLTSMKELTPIRA
ncbi:calcium/calmodulin-regulated receptor-like kinase 2 [Phragmites australis]|uniref:calcium/calmodulin-regulated receptor-like kinase 2 n=1 Tax=Phragmites australis TaxID=29695 RepID=UPI002D799616|nr:calcium/calmodulin-regulated receptor-like kinase 2 [Phragmites australis]XP_062233074.1 calcium/calmodulin-regulated receptor-like kinase 2 [Phragmites australis]